LDGNGTATGTPDAFEMSIAKTMTPISLKTIFAALT
jgi:hypothetical protein